MTVDLADIQEELRRRLRTHVAGLGKPSWRALLDYAADLHARSLHAPRPPLPREWEEIGPGYFFAPAFGHWDIVFQALDSLTAATDYAERQILNHLDTQQPDGRLPIVLMFRDGQAAFSEGISHPPVWPLAVDMLCRRQGRENLIARALAVLERQIPWWQTNRRAPDGGYYYLDILENRWESGVDEGVRFLDRPGAAAACLDATCHMHLCLDAAARWSTQLGRDGAGWQQQAEELAAMVRDGMFCPRTGMFHDAWTIADPARRVLGHETLWPLVAGIAAADQARRVIDEALLNPRRFLTVHPIPTVAVEDRRFELRMWRGPAWNSMTYWAAVGCLRYGRADAAATLLERALDATAAQFARTGTIWEFYHPFGDSPLACQRKPDQGPAVNRPCSDYLGHNPLIAMAELWRQATAQAARKPMTNDEARMTNE